ncbi:MAG TPA: hypothetical protein VFQ39_17430, partial [Longimicrobium sp.]|nr:hypothetical protein [Longimicrobium sp.]
MKMRSKAGAAALAVLATVLAATPVLAQRPDVAVVYRLLQERRMLVTPVGGTARTAALGERLRTGDVVSTSENTRAALRFTDDGSILRVNPKSQVTLTAGREGGAVVRTLNMEFGELWTRVV